MPRPGRGWGAPGTEQDLGPLVPCAKLPPRPPKICSGGRHHQIDGSGGRGRCCFQMLRAGSTWGLRPPRCFQGVPSRIWCEQILLGSDLSTTTTSSSSRKKAQEVYKLQQHRLVQTMAKKRSPLRSAMLKNLPFFLQSKKLCQIAHFFRKSQSHDDCRFFQVRLPTIGLGQAGGSWS